MKKLINKTFVMGALMASFLLVGCQSSKITSKEELANRFQAALKLQDFREFKSLTIVSLSDEELENQYARPVFELEIQRDPRLKEVGFHEIFKKTLLPKFQLRQKSFVILFDELVKNNPWLKEAKLVAIKAEDFELRKVGGVASPVEEGKLRLRFTLSGKNKTKIIDLRIANLSKLGWVIVDEPRVRPTNRSGLGGAAIGAAAGGAALNHKERGKGATVGALIGGAGGALIGNAKDSNKKREAQPKP